MKRLALLSIAAVLASCSSSPPKPTPTPSPSPTAVTKAFPVKGHPTAIAADASSVWFTDDLGQSLARVDAATAKEIWRTKICKAAPAMVRVHGVLWLVCSLDNTVMRVDAATGKLLGKVKTGGDPVD